MCIILSCVTAWISKNYFTLHPYYCVSIFPAMFFYCMGYVLRKRQFKTIIFVFSIAIFIFSFFYPSIVSFRTNQLTCGSYLLWLLYALAGIIIFNNVFSRIPYAVFPFTCIGEKSMYWFLMHWLILCSIRNIMQLIGIRLNGIYMTIGIFVILMIILTILSLLIYKTRLRKQIGL